MKLWYDVFGVFMANVKPTRSELIKLRKRIKLAKSGHSLLKRKRDGLIKELFEVLKKAKESTSKANEQFMKAQQGIDLARALDGTLAVKAASLVVKDDPNIDVRTKTVMGVAVPEISSQKEHFVAEFNTRGYGIIGTSAVIDDAASGYEQLLADIIVSAEIETTLKKLLYEVEKTKRRVNALEFNLIPRMQKDAGFITLRLEEMEREDIFRLKRFKQKSTKKKEEQ